MQWVPQALKYFTELRILLQKHICETPFVSLPCQWNCVSETLLWYCWHITNQFSGRTQKSDNIVQLTWEGLNHTCVIAEDFQIPQRFLAINLRHQVLTWSMLIVDPGCLCSETNASHPNLASITWSSGSSGVLFWIMKPLLPFPSD